MPSVMADDHTPLRLKSDAPEQLAALDERLRKPNGKPHHSEIISACGIGTTQWWRIRRHEQSPGGKSIPKLLDLAMRNGLTRDEAWALLFENEPHAEQAAA